MGAVEIHEAYFWKIISTLIKLTITQIVRVIVLLAILGWKSGTRDCRFIGAPLMLIFDLVDQYFINPNPKAGDWYEKLIIGIMCIRLRGHSNGSS